MTRGRAAASGAAPSGEWARKVSAVPTAGALRAAVR